METLPYSNYEVRVTRPSRFDPDATVTETVGMKCPRCKTQMAVMDNGESRKCPKCGLRMTLYGNVLTVRD